MMIPQSSSGHAIFRKKWKAKLLGPNIPIKKHRSKDMWVSEAHGFPTKATIIYLGLVKQPCWNGRLISMNAPSQRRAARFFPSRETGPIPFREELTMDCLAFQARPVVRSWDRTAESQNAAWYKETKSPCWNRSLCSSLWINRFIYFRS